MFVISHLTRRSLFALVAVAVAWCTSASTIRGATPYQPEIADPLLDPWRWQVFPELNGKGLRCLAEAGDETIWFGVNDGLMSYDGLVWSVTTPEDGLGGKPTNCLLATSDGRVYAGSEMGISVFRDSVWQTLHISAHPLRWFVNNLAEAPDGTLFAATSWGLLEISGKAVTLYTSSEKEAVLKTVAPDVAIVAVPRDAVPSHPWSGAQSGCIGARVVEETRRNARVELTPRIVWTVYADGPSDRAGLRAGDAIVAIDGEPDVGQDRLAGPMGSRVRLTVERLGRAEPFDVELARECTTDVFNEFSIHDVFVDAAGSVWLGLTDGEILRFRRGNGDWRLFSTADGLKLGGQPKIDQTVDGTLWAVYNAGESSINRFDGETWTNQRLGTTGNQDNSALLAISDGTLLVSGIVNMSRYRDGKWITHWHETLAVPKTRIAQFMETADGDVWVAALNGKAYRLDYSGRRWQTYKKLFYQAETSDGIRWFLSVDDGVVRSDGDTWTRYGVEDGLIDTSVKLIVTRNDDVWVSGGHRSAAATARFDGTRWVKQVYPRLGYTIEKRAAFEASDGAIWFGSAPHPRPLESQIGGVIRISGESVEHFTPPNVMRYIYGIGETPDGSVWFGSLRGMVRYDGQTWRRVTDAPPFTTSFVDEVHSAPNGDLWIGNRKYGVLRYDGENWDHYPMMGDLAQGRVNNVLVTTGGIVLASTPEGLNGFDGKTWTPHVMRPELPPAAQDGLRQTRDGALWHISYDVRWERRGEYLGTYPKGVDYSLVSIRYQPDRGLPDTKIAIPVAEVAQPGNTTIAWEGADRWDTTPRDRVQFAWRLDGAEWSVFGPNRNHTLLSLKPGDHSFEVKARDLDFNEDPTPDIVHFTVIPPVWQQFWFLTLMGGVFALLCWQGWRILRHRRDLLLANTGLAQANEGLQNEMAERQRVENELIRLERLRALGEMSAGVSHNLNNILTSILGPAQLIKRSTDDPNLKADVDMIIASATRAADLVHRLHLSTRTGMEDELEAVPVADVVAEAVQAARGLGGATEPESRGVSINVVTDIDDDRRVKGTGSGLHEILVNLLLNGVDAMPDGGVITVRGSIVDGWMTLTVTDSGMGMTEEIRRRVFEPFFTTKAEVGTGLGMSTAYAEVTRWGGTLQVDSELGVGTTFTMKLPLWEGSVDESQVPATSSPARRARLLVVDDDEMVRTLLGRLLGRNHDVTEAADGAEALADFSDGQHDVALVDLGLPGMPGDQVAMRLRQVDPAIVIILITGWELSADDRRASAFDLQMEKPFRDLSEVEGLVAEAIEIRDRRRAT